MSLDIEPFISWQKQVYYEGDRRWKVTSLIAQAKNLTLRKMPIDCLNLVAMEPDLLSMKDWVGHIKSVLNADLNYPIILDEHGRVMDGRHRIAKALLEGKDEICYVRFKETPIPDWYEDEDK